MSVRYMQLPGIDRLGKCSKCKEWMLLNEGETFIPLHDSPDREKCDGSKYSYIDFRYHITTRDEAVVGASFIRDDNNKCLYGRDQHSVSCRDGDYCEETRLLLAKALAEYVLTL